MVTGARIRERILEDYPELGFLGITTASGQTNYLIDTTRLNMSTLSPAEFGDAYIRISAFDINNNGYVGKVERIDPQTGRLYVSPSVSVAFASGGKYEVWSHGIRPDDPDRCRDRAFMERCSQMRLRALSVLSDCDTWSAATNATATAQQTTFPKQYAPKKLRVTNTGPNGHVDSEVLLVQPGETYRLTGLVSVVAQTASIRVLNVTAGNTDIALSGQTTFTLDGWQYVDVQFTVPAGCGQLRVAPGGASNGCIADWQALALLPTQAEVIECQARVASANDIGRLFSRLPQPGAVQSADRPGWFELPAARVRVADLLAIDFGYPAGAFGPVFYEERSYYAALQNAYLTASDRTAGDNATTDCPEAYIAAATVVELLEKRRPDDALALTLQRARETLNYWERQVGPAPRTVVETARRGNMRGVATMARK
ncbi:MAG TPA: hypothetical protein VNM91_11835 [Dehalococcoidia bacterium]|nr:hypothetical protein [Dehalococcoidia bacterium]